MAKFTIKCMNKTQDLGTEFTYDNQTSELLDFHGNPALEVNPKDYQSAQVTSIDSPLGKTSPKTLKISLGLSCNYECSYCSQRFVPHADSTNPKDVDKFVNELDAWVTTPPERIEFWGGEPLVYWKTLKPLAEMLRNKYPNATFIMITNGSLLDIEKNKWLDHMGFHIGMSHDGPGYHVRGLDPLENEEQRNAIMDLYGRLKPKGRMSINAVLHKDNQSRKDIQDFLIKAFGDNVNIGEGSYIDPYDQGGMESSLLSPAEQIGYRQQAISNIRNNSVNNFNILHQKIHDFIESIRTARPANAVGQKCGMDKPDNIAVDLNGNVVTCQNVSAVSVAPNMESHKIGHISDMESVKLKTSTHWSKRKDCPDCPVLQLCKGSCMFLEGGLWDAGCNNSFSDNIPFFAAAIETLTGYIPYYIEGPQREDRKDIFGLVNGIQIDKQKKPFPIPVVAA